MLNFAQFVVSIKFLHQNVLQRLLSITSSQPKLDLCKL